jgi:hypothetical protein
VAPSRHRPRDHRRADRADGVPPIVKLIIPDLATQTDRG